jgi:hypothetical protein
MPLARQSSFASKSASGNKADLLPQMLRKLIQKKSSTASNLAAFIGQPEVQPSIPGPRILAAEYPVAFF